jgi:hypothetical protein
MAVGDGERGRGRGQNVVPVYYSPGYVTLSLSVGPSGRPRLLPTTCIRLAYSEHTNPPNHDAPWDPASESSVEEMPPSAPSTLRRCLR